MEEGLHFGCEVLEVLKQEGVSGVAVQHELRVRQFLNRRVRSERIDHDVVSAIGV